MKDRAADLDGSDLLGRGPFPDSGLRHRLHVLILRETLRLCQSLPGLKGPLSRQAVWV